MKRRHLYVLGAAGWVYVSVGSLYLILARPEFSRFYALIATISALSFLTALWTIGSPDDDDDDDDRDTQEAT